MKKLELEGYGTLFLNGIDFKSNEGVNVDAQGNPVEHFVERGKSGYKDKDGNVLTSKEVHKKFLINEEEVVMAKLKPTTKIDKESLFTMPIDEAYREVTLGVERKIYALVSDSIAIKEALKENAIVFPFVSGFGFKVWKAFVMNHTTTDGKSVLAMFLVRGNIDKAFEQYVDQPIEIEIAVVPDNSLNVKKLFSVM